MTNGIRDLAALAADDSKIECLLTDPAERMRLAEYADEWDVMVEAAEEEHNRLALVRPALPWYLLPIAVISIAILLAVVL